MTRISRLGMRLLAARKAIIRTLEERAEAMITAKLI